MANKFKCMLAVAVVMVTFSFTKIQFFQKSDFPITVAIESSRENEIVRKKESETLIREALSSGLKSGISEEQVKQLIKPIDHRLVFSSMTWKSIVYKISEDENVFVIATFLRNNDTFSLSKWSVEKERFGHYFE